MTLNEVLYPIVEQIARKLRDEEEFAEDPELYTVALLLEASRNLEVGRTIYGALELTMADDNVEKARELLNRTAEH
jgi:hypothetical protein